MFKKRERNQDYLNRSKNGISQNSKPVHDKHL